ncbi:MULTISPECIES: NUDIX hydrolase [Clostridium]|jgi:ADP-ribose pyrophosphatase|uniref:NUDIX domain-containing protein n=1 Tax=Clostridium butyricum TaxID=1492 RepID=A0A6M0UHH9_CLOBU|nr:MULTISPECIES: NUDIX hydrolase [Clostridium]ETI87922.1 MAG: Nudix-family hydrolase [Clostridium butyricum DORA_1]ALP90520.1 DNA mismatch repair protein MutT [Clostridium butyricum]ALS17023.1 DNA mismatch repair protein MutT [Clostridium butyricum]ANF14139.1 DNA mismatch repair protein MutT [Clostridium butyricum]AOR94206.1 DNA mismatch repair protein MutT [Clostridium butyricum]
MKHSKVTGLKALSKTKFLSMYEAEYENRVGNKKSWMIASRKSEEVLKGKFFENNKDDDDAVVIAALHKPSNKLVLVRQFRVPVNDFVYELTAGLIDEGEDFKTSVKRELKEETGLDLKDIAASKSKLYLSPGMTDECVNLVFCTCEGELSCDNMEEDECIEPMLISKEEATEIIKSNNNLDIKCYLVLQNFIIFGEKLFDNL